MSDTSEPRERQVIMIQGGIADPNQAYERMRVYTETGEPWVPAAGGIGEVAPSEHDAPTSIKDAWVVLDADNKLQLTVSGKVWSNANHDPGKVVLMCSDDGGATGTLLDQLATTTASPGVDYTLRGIVPAGWSVYVGFTQDAAGMNGNCSVVSVVSQVLN